MTHHSRTACNAVVVFAIVIVGTLGCADSETVTNTRNQAGQDELQGSNALIGEMESSSEDIVSIVDAIFRSINEGAFEKLYESATAPKFREVASLDDFKAICERVQSRLGALLSKQSSRFDLDPVAGGVVASASFHADFEHGSGTIFVVFEQKGDEWLLLRLNVNAPELLDDPTRYRDQIQLFVEDSDPVLPGTAVDILDSDVHPPKVVVENVSVLNVRWKVTDPSSKLQFPACGFVTIGLTKDQTISVKAVQMISIRRHAGAIGEPDGLP